MARTLVQMSIASATGVIMVSMMVAVLAFTGGLA